MPRRKAPPEPPARRKRGAGSISVQADGSLLARAPASIDKRRPSREFPPGRRDLAEAWLDAIVHPQPVAVTTAPVTLGEWAGTWYETYVEPVMAPNTARWYLYALRLLSELYPLPLDAVRASQFQAVVGTVGKTRDAATVQAVVGVWRRCFDAAIEDELLTRNPTRRLTLPKVGKRSPARHITEREAALLRDAIIGERFEAAFALILGCGLRMGEILGLPWRNVDLANARAWIEPQYTNGHWRSTPKAANPHWIPLPSFVVTALIRHRNSQPAGTTLVMESTYPYAGRPRRGKKLDGPRPWSAQVVNSDLAALVKRLGLDHLTAHAGRHGLATYLMAAGIAPPVIAERLGNTPGVILNTYGHPTATGQKQAGVLIDQYLGGSSDSDAGTQTA